MRALQNEEIDAINATAARLGVDARDLATLMAYETIGTLNPGITGGANKDGTGRGSFKGLIQFSPANQRHYGVTGQETFPEQLTAVERYLRDTGVQPGMPLKDLYSAVLTGAPGRYNRSDINGNVLQHVARMEKNYGPRVDQAFDLYDSTRLANYAADQEENIGQQAFQDLLNPTQRFEQVAGLNYEALPTPSAKPSSAMVERQTAPIPETTRGLMAALGSPSPQARPAETRVDSVAAEIPRSTGGLLAALGAPAAPMTQPGNANQRVAGAFSMFDQPAPLDALPTGTTIPSRSIASPLEAAPEAAIATNNSPQSVGRATKQKDEEDGKGKIGWSPFVGAALGSLVGSPMLGAALGAAYGAGKLPSFGGLFDAIPGVNVPFATAEGFNQTQWGQARNAGFVDGQYNSDRAVDAGLFAGDLSASDWASRSALDQRDRAAAGEKTWADAFGGLFG